MTLGAGLACERSSREQARSRSDGRSDATPAAVRANCSEGVPADDWPTYTERFMTVPIGNESMNPPYTPTTDTVPPLRTAVMASRRAMGRSVSSPTACLARS